MTNIDQDSGTFILVGLVDFRRLRPATWFLDDVTVTGDTSAGFTVAMRMMNCAHNISLLKFEGTTVSLMLIMKRVIHQNSEHCFYLAI